MRGPPGPGGQLPRKPLKTPPISPDTVSWDTPFPTFPGAKKKTSISEEQEILQKMNNMEISQGRPRTAGSKGSQDKYPRNAPTDDYGRPSLERRPTDERRPVDDYARGSPDSQRNPRGPPQGPPQQGYQDPRRGPPPQNFGPPVRTNTYQEPSFNDRGDIQTPISPMKANFGPPSRSMTMPNEAPMPMNQRPPMPMDAGPSAPYNGPVGRGRGLPARPTTASSSRPPPQRTYPPPDPPMDDYANGGDFPNHERGESVSDLYDDYYNAPDPYSRTRSDESGMPNFDAVPMNTGAGKRGASIDQHIQPPPQVQTGGAYQQPQPMNSQQGFGGRGQPQAASFEMAGDAPRQNGYPNQRYDDGFGQYNPRDQRGPPSQGYDDYDNRPPPANTFLPPRPASAASRPGPGFSGLPSGPKPGYQNGPPPPPNGEMDRNSFPGQTPPGGPGLPSHPPPVRAGLIPNSVAAQANNKPPPVRNYNNISPAQQPGPSPSPSASSIAPSQAPVTTAELEQLRLTVRNNPNDQASAMLLVKRLVEASEVLVPTIPDQRARNKAREKYIMDAHKILKKLVATQHTEAMFYLADCYGRGALGLETDPKEAFTLYQSAAKAGHAGAAYRTAVCCELGSDDGGGTRKDPLKAIQWYKRAAMLGDTPAMYKMGMIQLKGLLGQPKNPREAVGWLKRAAERADIENPHALHELGLLYEAPQTPDGSLVRDEAYSFKLFQQAADLGYKFSQFRLGCAYEYGLFNCPIDPRTSIAWYSKAAQQEEHQSELALSGWYLTGSEGVLQQSDTEAYLWARKAAMAGLAKAEYAMGYFTEVGIGSPANLEDAKRWYWRAAGMLFCFHLLPRILDVNCEC